MIYPEYRVNPENPETTGSCEGNDCRGDRISHASYRAACNIHQTAKKIRETDDVQSLQAIFYNRCIRRIDTEKFSSKAGMHPVNRTVK